MTRAEVVIGFSESSEHIGLRASYIDDGVKLYGSTSSPTEESAALTIADKAASSSFVDRVAQLGLLDQTTLSAASSLSGASLAERNDRFGMLANAA